MTDETTNIANEHTAIGAICDLLAEALESAGSAVLVAATMQKWSWVNDIPIDERPLMLRDITNAVETCKHDGTLDALINELAAWQGTARAWASKPDNAPIDI